MKNILLVYLLISAATLVMQGCTDANVPEETQTIPTPAPANIIKIAPAPPPRILVGDKEIIIDDLLSRKLGLPTKHQVTYQKADTPWSLQCGKAVSADGSPLDFNKSKMAKQASQGFLDNKYCALFQEQGKQYKLVEFDFGNTDSQIFTWLKRHKIPVNMLK